MQPCLCKRMRVLAFSVPLSQQSHSRFIGHLVISQICFCRCNVFLAICLLRQDVTLPGKRVLVSFGKTRGPPSSGGQYTAFLLWRLAGFSALAWDHCRLKSDQWQCEGQGVNLNLSLSPEFRFVEAGGMGLWEGAVSLDLEGLGGPGHCLCFLMRIVVGISVVSQHWWDLLSCLNCVRLSASRASCSPLSPRSGKVEHLR